MNDQGRSELANELWRRVDNALDERRDPFDDAELARALAAAPDVSADVQRLMRRLSGLAAVGEVRQPRRRRVGLATAAGLLVVASLVVVGQLRSSAWTGWFRSDPAARSASASPASSRHGVLYDFEVTIDRSTVHEPTLKRVVHQPNRVVACSVAGVTQELSPEKPR